MRRLLLAAVFLIITVPCLRAQKKELSQARTYIKSGKDYDKAEQLMATLLADGVHATNIDVRRVYAEAICKQYQAVNVEAYRGEPYDTASLFHLTRRLFLAYEGLDSVDALPDDRGRVRPRLRRKNAAFLLPMRANLYSGGVFFMRRRQYADAYTFFDTYIDCGRQPLLAADIPCDTREHEAASRALCCGYRLNDTSKVFRHMATALADTAHLDRTYRYIAETYHRCNDTLGYVRALTDGFALYSDKEYFSTRLIDYHNARGNTTAALAVADRALAARCTPLLLLAKSNILLNTGDYDHCIALCDTLIALCDTIADAYYNAGAAYVNRAYSVEQTGASSAQAMDEARSFYSQARPYMERYRALRPDDRDKWASPLYNIYLRLNLGRQFEEIERLLR